MTRTVVADAAMSACAHAASARGVSGRMAARSCRLGPARQQLPHQRAEMRRPEVRRALCPRQPVPVHPLYLYLPQWHVATLFGWSFDPGRDILCILISPLRWSQWP